MAPNSTHDVSALAARLDAVERAVATDDGGDSPPSDGSALERGDSGATDADDPNDREAGDRRDAEIEALRERVATLEAELDAVRGLLGGVRTVGESVERRADAALAKVERLESSMAAESDLVVERVPADDLPDDAGPRETGAETAATDRPSGTEDAESEEANTLAARLREAL